MHYGELRVRVPQSLSEHMFPHIDMLLMQTRSGKALEPRYSHSRSSVVLAHVLGDEDDPCFKLMQYGSPTKGFENVPFTPHHRVLATWLWDMITFTFEMTFNEVNLSQTVGTGLASAALRLRIINQEYYRALDMWRFKEVILNYNNLLQALQRHLVRYHS